MKHRAQPEPGGPGGPGAPGALDNSVAAAAVDKSVAAEAGLPAD